MPRYIDAEQFICSLDGSECLDTERDYEEIERRLEEFETADVQEVRHGKWIKCNAMRRDDGEIYDYCCSECSELACKDDYNNHAILSAYCSHCGAKMDGE